MIAWLRRALPFLAVALLVALVYDGWVFYSRWQSKREIEREQREREAQEARHVIDALGGGQLKILNFYATPGTIARGEQARLCYGVYGAKTVQIEPRVADLYPAIAHCVDVSPAKSTEYILTAQDASGHTTKEQLMLRVR